jgi:ABC-2 type transport system ATP-binding protein
MAEVQRMCHRVIFLDRGRVVADGTPSDVVSRFGAIDLEDTFLSIVSGDAS